MSGSVPGPGPAREKSRGLMSKVFGGKKNPEKTTKAESKPPQFNCPLQRPLNERLSAVTKMMDTVQRRMKQNPFQGIYRTGGSESKTRALNASLSKCATLDMDKTIQDENETEAIGKLLKQQIREDQELHIHSEDYNKAIIAAKIQDRDERKAAIKTLIQSLPPQKQALLKHLAFHCNHLANDEDNTKKLISETTKMNSRNLAIVFAQSLLVTTDKDKLIIDPQYQATFIQEIIDAPEFFFGSENKDSANASAAASSSTPPPTLSADERSSNSDDSAIDTNQETATVSKENEPATGETSESAASAADPVAVTTAPTKATVTRPPVRPRIDQTKVFSDPLSKLEIKDHLRESLSNTLKMIPLQVTTETTAPNEATKKEINIIMGIIKQANAQWGEKDGYKKLTKHLLEAEKIKLAAIITIGEKIEAASKRSSAEEQSTPAVADYSSTTAVGQQHNDVTLTQIAEEIRTLIGDAESGKKISDKDQKTITQMYKMATQYGDISKKLSPEEQKIIQDLMKPPPPAPYKGPLFSERLANPTKPEEAPSTSPTASRSSLERMSGQEEKSNTSSTSKSDSDKNNPSEGEHLKPSPFENRDRLKHKRRQEPRIDTRRQTARAFELFKSQDRELSSQSSTTRSSTEENETNV